MALDEESELLVSSFGQSSDFELESEPEEPDDWLRDGPGDAVDDCAHALPTPRPPTTSALAANVPMTTRRIFDMGSITSFGVPFGARLTGELDPQSSDGT